MLRSLVHTRTHAWLLGALAIASGCGKVIGSDEIAFYEPECTTQSECADFSPADPRICHENRCVALRNDRPDTIDIEGQCRQVLGAENLQSSFPPIVLGAFSIFDTDLERLTPISLNYDLVVRDFEANGILVGGATHLPVLVVCNALSSDTLDESFDHLTSTLGITGIVAPLPPDVLKRSFERIHGLEREVFVLSPFGSNSLLEQTEDDGLLWHMLGPPVGVGPAYAPLIRRIEEYSNPADAAGQRPKIRLALVDSDQAQDKDIAQYVDAHLTLNGADATANGNEYYRRFRVISGDNASYIRALKQLAEFRPHILILLAGEPILQSVVLPLEGSWHSIAPGQAPPFYVLSDHQFATQPLLDLLRGLPTDFRQRLVGVNPAGARDTTLYDSYLRQLEATNQTGFVIENIENYYDAAYFLIYAAAAARTGSGRASGREMSHGMTRLVSGPRFDVGAADIPAAVSWLNASRENTLSLYGTLGAPDFDLEHGTRRHVEGSIWCVEQGDGEDQFVFRYNVLRLNSEADELEGNFGCFPGF
jgi:hypothetical protein